MTRTTILFCILAYYSCGLRAAQPHIQANRKAATAISLPRNFFLNGEHSLHTFQITAIQQICAQDSLPPHDLKPIASRVNPSSMLSVVFGTFALIVGIDAGLTVLGLFLMVAGLAAVLIGIRYLKKDKTKFSKEGLAAAGYSKKGLISLIFGLLSAIVGIAAGPAAAFFPLVCGISAIILGISGLKKKEGKLGKLMSTLGIIAGSIGTLIGLWIAYIIAFFIKKLLSGNFFG